MTKTKSINIELLVLVSVDISKFAIWSKDPGFVTPGTENVIKVSAVTFAPVTVKILLFTEHKEFSDILLTS